MLFNILWYNGAILQCAVLKFCDTFEEAIGSKQKVLYNSCHPPTCNANSLCVLCNANNHLMSCDMAELLKTMTPDLIPSTLRPKTVWTLDLEHGQPRLQDLDSDAKCGIQTPRQGRQWATRMYHQHHLHILHSTPYVRIERDGCDFIDTFVQL